MNGAAKGSLCMCVYIETVVVGYACVCQQLIRVKCIVYWFKGFIIIIWYFNFRLINEFISTGSLSSPPLSLPLPLRYTLPPTAVYLALLAVVMGTAKGRQWNLGMTLFLSVVGLLIVQRM